MRLLPAPALHARPSSSWRAMAVVAAAAIGACSLDSTGVEPSTASSTSAATGSTASATSATTSTSTGDGAGPATGTGGDGGGTTSGGGSPATGGGGAGGDGQGGGGGAGGRGGSDQGGGGQGGGTGGAGGQGGSGPLDEWFARVHGTDTQQVNGVAVGRDGAVYVVGTARQDVASIDGDDLQTIDPDLDDVFVAKLSGDGATIEWFVSFGGTGDDRGLAIALGVDADDEEHLYVAGVAQNVATDAERFVPGAIPTTNEWGFVMELTPDLGVAVGGTVWGNVDLAAPVGVTTIDGTAFAVGTCQTVCVDSLGTPNQGRDVIVARYPFDVLTDAWRSRLIARPGDQQGIAIAASPATRGFAILGEMSEASYDAGLGIAPSTCNAATHGARDTFVARYEFGVIDFVCEGVTPLGSTGNDQAHALAYDGATSFVGLTTENDDVGGIGVRGTYVAVVAGDALALTSLFATEPASSTMSLVLDGSRLGVAGRIQDRGFIASMNTADGLVGERRGFSTGFNHARGLAIDGTRWFVGGAFDATVDFGGTIGMQTAQSGRDGWIALMNPPQ